MWTNNYWYVMVNIFTNTAQMQHVGFLKLPWPLRVSLPCWMLNFIVMWQNGWIQNTINSGCFVFVFCFTSLPIFFLCFSWSSTSALFHPSMPQDLLTAQRLKSLDHRFLIFWIIFFDWTVCFLNSLNSYLDEWIATWVPFRLWFCLLQCVISLVEFYCKQ